MDYFKLVTAIFAISYTLVYTSGPFSVFYWLQQRLSVLQCVPCVSFWLCMALVPTEGLKTALSVWGVCILIDLLTRGLDV